MPKRDWVMREMEVIAVHKEQTRRKITDLELRFGAARAFAGVRPCFFFFPAFRLKRNRENIYVLEIPNTLGLNLCWSFGAGHQCTPPIAS